MTLRSKPVYLGDREVGRAETLWRAVEVANQAGARINARLPGHGLRALIEGPHGWYITLREVVP